LGGGGRRARKRSKPDLWTSERPEMKATVEAVRERIGDVRKIEPSVVRLSTIVAIIFGQVRSRGSLPGIVRETAGERGRREREGGDPLPPPPRDQRQIW
jgi:hypothetical protein